MDDKMEKILISLESGDFKTAKMIAVETGISEKTARTRIKELDYYLKSNGARIISKRHYGYRLEIQDTDEYHEFRISGNARENTIPNNSNERVFYILAYLLNHPDYIKLDDLSEFLCISRNTLTADLAKVEYILNMYHLNITRKPNHGICVSGEEFYKRSCIANSLIKRDRLGIKNKKQTDVMKMIGNIIIEVLQKNKMKISESSFENLIIHVYVANGRIHKGYKMVLNEESRSDIRTNISENTLVAAKEFAQQMDQKLSIIYSEEEILYFAIHMGGKISSDSSGKYGSNIIISSQIDEMVLHMLEVVYESHKLDFRYNLELRMALNQHMVPFTIRMQYDIPLKNPMLEQMKREYAFAFTIASTACASLKKYYRKEVVEDEIGYFAVLFALAIEKRDRIINKKNIVVVCMSGRGTSQLFMYKYKQAFGKYIDKMYECSVFELEKFDFSSKRIDYVFTTVPLDISLGVPIFEISLFLEDREILNYSRLFAMGKDEILLKYYDKRLFTNSLDGNDKEIVLQKMCELAGKYYSIPDDFYESVCKREELGQTDLGNLIAIPHPCKVMTKDSFVVAAVLGKPVWWGHNDVQVVFLVSLSEEEDADIEYFYQMTTNFLFDAEAVNTLIQNPEFDVLLRLLDEMRRK